MVKNSIFVNYFHPTNFIMLRGIKRRLVTLIISTAILIIFFTIHSYLLKLDHDSYRELIRSLKIIARRNSAIKPAQNKTTNKCIPQPLPVFESGEWIVNSRVAQYSAYLTVQNDDDDLEYDSAYIINGNRPNRRRLILETLVLFDYPFLNERYILSRAKMLIRLNDDEFVLLNIERAFRRRLFSSKENSLQYMWKLTTSLSLADKQKSSDSCCAKADFNLLDKIVIATIDIDELENLIWSQHAASRNNDQHSSSNNYLESIVIFQKPHLLVVDTPAPVKKKAVAHCVHMLRNVDTSRLGKLNDWLRLQKSVGYDKIHLYTYKVDESMRDEIKNFDPEMIQLTEFDIEFESVCKYQITLLNKGKLGLLDGL